jgi:hypothetical protein
VWYNVHMRTIKSTNSDSNILVDDEDYPVLSRLNWYISDMGYAITDSPVKHLKMHKLLIGPLTAHKVIDHIDRNKLNNQKDNLRVVSQSVNVTNSYRHDSAKHYYWSKTRGWVVDSRQLGVRYLSVPNPMIADRVVKRLKLGFPKDVALKEAVKPIISVTNWERNNITYKEFLRAKREGVTIKEVRLKSKRGPKVA